MAVEGTMMQIRSHSQGKNHSSAPIFRLIMCQIGVSMLLFLMEKFSEYNSGKVFKDL